MVKATKKKTVTSKGAKNVEKTAKRQITLEERVETLERNVLALTLCVAGLIGFLLVYAIMKDDALWRKVNSQLNEQSMVIVDEGE